MTKSETWLTVIAIRLAALVFAGIVAKTAAADHPQPEIACAPATAVVSVRPSLPAVGPEVDEMLRDMRLHD